MQFCRSTRVLIDGLPLEAPAAPLADLLRVGLDAEPEAPALVSAHRTMSWRELEDEAGRLAGGYREMGLGPGDRIASLMPNRLALVQIEMNGRTMCVEVDPRYIEVLN